MGGLSGLAGNHILKIMYFSSNSCNPWAYSVLATDTQTSNSNPVENEITDIEHASHDNITRPEAPVLNRRRLPLTLPTLLFTLNPPIQNLIHNTQLQRLLSTHEIIPLHQLLNLIQAQLLLPRKVLLINPIQLRAHPQDLLRVDGDIRCLAEVSARGLVHHYRGMRETVSFAGVAAAEEEGAHRGGLADADCAYW